MALVFALVAAGCGLIGAFIWSGKEGSALFGFVIGFCFSLLGLIALSFMTPSRTRTQEFRQDAVVWRPGPGQQAGMARVPTKPVVTPPPTGAPVAAAVPMRPCPHCGQPVQADNAKCPNCGEQSASWRLEGSRWMTKDDAGREWWLDPAGNWALARRNKFCPNCRAELGNETTICPECGQASTFV